MATTAKSAPVLSEEEWLLVQELLDREHRELLTEVRHTYAREYRNRLKRRQEMAEALLKRLSADKPA